jgi:type I restriction enzyme, S subunit
MTFPRYETNKDSGIDWLGEMPEHWHSCALKRLVWLRSGDAITAEDINEIGAFPVYGGNGLRGYTETYTHEGQHVLIGRQGALCGNINYAAGKFWASEHAVVVTPLRQVEVRWLGELLRAMNLNQYSVSAAQPGLSVEAVSRLRVPVPPLSEQSAIATFLDRETAKIDALVSEQQRLIELLNEKRQAVISHAVTKGLDPNTPMKASGVEWLGAVPAHWEVKRLRHLVASKAGPFGSSLTKDQYVSSGYRVYGQEQVIPGDFSIGDYYLSEEKFAELAQYEVRPGDVLVSCVGTFGKVAVVPDKVEPGVINPRLIRLRMTSSVIPKYLEAVLRSRPVYEQFSLLSRGGTMDVINIETLSGILVVIPPVHEQHEILGHLDRRTGDIDALVNQSERAVYLLNERRTALISAAVTGKIDVRRLVEVDAPIPNVVAA